jgi:ABC-type multidrug transport system fused ATPase/permease subunit
VNILALVAIAMYRIVSFSSTLTLIVLPFLVFLAWRAVVFQTRQRPLMLETQQKVGELTVILQEALSGIRVVKAFSQEEQEKRKFHAPAEEVYGKQVAAQTLQAVNSPMMTISVYFAMLVVLIFGAFEVQAGRMTIGELSAFTLYLQLLAQPVRMLGFIVTMYSRASAAGERIFEVLDTESAVQDKPNAIDVGRLQGAVEFRHVSFGYDAISPVLRDVTFEASPGEVIALLGPTGSGKTTIVSLLPRFYDVTGGSISIDGVDLRDLRLASLRRNIGMVLQDPFLFTGTIRDNILYSKPDATEEEMIAAAKAARIPISSCPCPTSTKRGLANGGLHSRAARSSASQSHEHCCSTRRF